MYATSFTEIRQIEMPIISYLAMYNDRDSATCSQNKCYIAVTVEWKTKEKRKFYFSSSSAIKVALYTHVTILYVLHSEVINSNLTILMLSFQCYAMST